MSPAAGVIAALSVKASTGRNSIGASISITGASSIYATPNSTLDPETPT